MPEPYLPFEKKEFVKATRKDNDKMSSDEDKKKVSTVRMLGEKRKASTEMKPAKAAKKVK